MKAILTWDVRMIAPTPYLEIIWFLSVDRNEIIGLHFNKSLLIVIHVFHNDNVLEKYMVREQKHIGTSGNTAIYRIGMFN